MSFDPKVTLVETWEEASEFRRWLGERRPILAIDTETTGLNWWEPNFLRTTQFGDGEQAFVLPQEWWGKLVKDSVEGYTGPIVGHNIKFEMHAFESAGIRLPRARLEDTQFLGWLSNPAERAGLKPLSVRHVDPRASFPEYLKGKYFRENKVSWHNVPVDAMPYWFYGGWDPIITARIWEYLQPWRGEGYDLEMSLLPLVADMESAGMGVDLQYIDTTRKAWREEMDALLVQLRQYGLENPNSGPQVEAALKGEGWEPEEFTKTGRAKLDKGILLGIPHEIGDLVIQYKRLSKWDSTYLRNLQTWEDDGRVHANIKQCEARTGRMSVVNPPLQTQPRGPIIRDCFVPGDGQSLLTIDYAQIELRLLAHFSGDSRMVEQFRAGEDLHNQLALAIYGPGFTKDQRTTAKNSWFAKAYGASVEKFAETAGIEVDQAQSIYDGIDSTYPGIFEYQKRTIDIGKTRLALEGVGYVRLDDGTELPADDDAQYALVDFELQGTAAKILKRAAVSLDNAGYGGYLRMFVHDEVIAEVPTQDAEEILHGMVEVMNDPDTYAVPLLVEGEVCPTSWGSKYR